METLILIEKIIVGLTAVSSVVMFVVGLIQDKLSR